MGVFDEAPPSAEGSRIRRKLILLAGVIVAGIAAWMTWSREEPAAPPPAHTAKPAGAATRPRADATRPSPGPAVREPAVDAPPASPSAARPAPETSRPTGVLRVRSDVPGASVFLDRRFLGTTPLDVDGLPPGSHRLNVSVAGYEGHAQPVEIGEAPAEVEVRFKEVRLNASVPVVHKHGVGSCSGRLVADTRGLRYETSKADDAFSLGFGELETFTVDYLKKALRVKQRGGRTWNFEDPNGQADPLFVFHRDVEKARARLAGS